MSWWRIKKSGHPNVSLARKYAKKNKWKEIIHSEDNKLISFTKKCSGVWVRLNVYYTTMTVGTAMDHPKKGKTQLFRRNVNEKTLKALFQNPRTHTGNGYYKKFTKKLTK